MEGARNSQGSIEPEASEEHPSSWLYGAEMKGFWAAHTNLGVTSLFELWIWIKLPRQHVTKVED